MYVKIKGNIHVQNGVSIGCRGKSGEDMEEFYLYMPRDQIRVGLNRDEAKLLYETWRPHFEEVHAGIQLGEYE